MRDDKLVMLPFAKLLWTLVQKAAVHHLGFVVCMFEPRTKSISWSLLFCKLRWNRFSSFDNMQVIIFCMFGMKMPIHSSFLVVFWGYNPEMGYNINEMSKRSI